MNFKLNWIFVVIFTIAYLLCVSNKLFSMDYNTSSDSETEFYESDDTEKEEGSGIDAIDDKILQSMTINNCISRPIISEDLFYLTSKFIKNSSEMYLNSSWHSNENISEKLKSILRESSRFQIDSGNYIDSLPCLAKLIVPQNTRVAIVGDIHAEIDTIESIFYSLKNKNFINELMRVPDDAVIVFLGDYTDRGEYNLAVLCAILILSAKNPGQVFLLKGNHEFYIDENSKIIDEIKEIETSEITIEILSDNILKTYELMPAGMFLGFNCEKQKDFYFLAHGGPDIRYDYTNFLNSDSGNLSFWMLDEKDILQTPKIQTLFKQIEKNMAPNKIVIETLKSHIDESLIYGFLWNDFIENNCEFPILKSIRGESCISLNPKLISCLMQSYTNEKIKFSGIIRGHQHTLTKKISSAESASIITPSCSFFTSNLKDGNLLRADSPIFLNNIFSIITVISGPINMGTEIIQYLPTFLELSILKNGTHKIEAIEKRI